MPPDQSLIQWIQEQYWVLGIKSSGAFIGKKQFKHLLLSRLEESERAEGHSKTALKREKGKIRQLINA
jgi:hypothetical protein